MPVNTEIQQKTVLKALMDGPKTTVELRRLNVLSPAPRVLELREGGFYIETEWAYFDDSDGVEHKIGEYHFRGYDGLTLRGEQLLASISR
jgi:hypothetical protein